MVFMGGLWGEGREFVVDCRGPYGGQRRAPIPGISPGDAFILWLWLVFKQAAMQNAPLCFKNWKDL